LNNIFVKFLILISILAFIDGYSSLINKESTRQKFFNALGGVGNGNLNIGTLNRRRLNNQNRQPNNRIARGGNNGGVNQRQVGGRGRLGFIGGGLFGRRRGRISPGAFNAGLGGRFGLYFPNAILDN
jgi:hypothetical protein